MTDGIQNINTWKAEDEKGGGKEEEGELWEETS